MTVGVVLAGGGARGAYEAGALSVIIPALAERGERASLYTGTSVGAINAAAIASLQALDPVEAAERGLARWRQVCTSDVMGSVPRQLPRLARRYLALLAGRGPGVSGLLDSAPLRSSLRAWIDWEALHSNVGAGSVRSVAAIATQAISGKTIAFVEGRLPPPRRPSHAVTYAASPLCVEHVFASTAVPVVFSPVGVSRPGALRGWYLDGAVRLHAPLKPALDLGAERLVIVGTTPLEPGGADNRDREQRPPRLAAAAVNLLNAVLEDTLAEDVRTLASVNEFFAGDRPGVDASVRYREARGKPPYRPVPYVFIAPARRGLIADIAERVYRERYRGVRPLRSPDVPLLRMALGGDGPLQGEFLSYVLFDRDFIDELIELGCADARRWLAANEGLDGPWRLRALPEVAGRLAYQAAP